MEELLPVRNAFLIGNYSSVLQEAKNVTSNDTNVTKALKLLVLRSQLESGNYDAVHKAVDKNADLAFQTLKLFATYKASADDNKADEIFEELKSWLSDPQMVDEYTSLLAAQIYYESNNLKEALRLVHDATDLDRRALAVQIYLQIDRIDLAEKVVKSMQEVDDDDTLTALASVWVNIAQGGEAVNNAFDTLNELLEKFGPTIRLLNSLGVCQIHLRNYTEAFGFLKQARDLALEKKEKVSVDTLINTIVCLTHLRKPQPIIQRIVGELTQVAPNHPWLQKQNELSEIFDKCAANYNS